MLILPLVEVLARLLVAQRLRESGPPCRTPESVVVKPGHRTASPPGTSWRGSQIQGVGASELGRLAKLTGFLSP
jgi:hypothetical protein